MFQMTRPAIQRRYTQIVLHDRKYLYSSSSKVRNQTEKLYYKGRERVKVTAQQKFVPGAYLTVSIYLVTGNLIPVANVARIVSPLQ